MYKKHSLFLLPKMKKKSIKTIKKNCDKLWSQIIKSKNNGCCERCGAPYANQPHHVVGRKTTVLRWDLRNGCLLCTNCHLLQSYSAHNDPIGFIKWFRKNHYKDYLYLCKKRKEIVHYTISDCEEIYQKLLEVKDEIQKQY